MKPPRGLTADEAALWRKVAATVTPLAGKCPPPWGEAAARSAEGGGASVRNDRPRPARSISRCAVGPAPPKGEDSRSSLARGLDGTWDRKLARGAIQPDFTLDLHGASLEAAHGRLLHGLSQAKAAGARVVLLVTGKPRAADPADRARRRGAIRAKVIDWLAASEHASAIAAIRKAHPRHGGEGALYVVLRRKR